MTAIPALPDSERRTTAVIADSVGPITIDFAIYGNGTDFSDWVAVWDDGVKTTPITDWTLDSPSGSLATLPRPITDARITFTTARTGTIEIEGADRPQRATQVTEGGGVSARAFNQAITHITARLREIWDVLRTRTIYAIPGEAVDLVLPVVADRQGKALTFDSDGALTATTLDAVGTVVANDTITDAFLVNMAGVSVKGRAANSTGDPADITASANGQILVRLSNALAFSTITAALDSVFGSTRGMILRRETAAWAAYALGTATHVLTSNGTDAAWAAATTALPRGFHSGGILSNGTDATNDINNTAGSWRDITNTANITVSAQGKQLDQNWAPGGTSGTPLGGRNSAAAIADGTYHYFTVSKADGNEDKYFYKGVAGTDPDTAAYAATVLAAVNAEANKTGADYVYARRLGSRVRVGGAIQGFMQYRNEVVLNTPVEEFSAAYAAATAVNQVIDNVPTGIKHLVTMNAILISATTGGGGYSYFSSLDSTDSAASGTIHSVQATTNDADGFSCLVRVRTDNSATIRTRTNITGAADVTRGNLTSWIDPLGEDV